MPEKITARLYGEAGTSSCICVEHGDRQSDIALPAYIAPEVMRRINSAESLAEACRIADDALCMATWVKGTDKRDLEYASKKCRDALAGYRKESDA